MKIAIAQLNYHIGDFEQNAARIIGHIGLAKAGKADLVLFSELSICGYPPLDFLDFSHFIELCSQTAGKIAEHCQGITAIVGAPSVNPVLAGKNLFNSAWVLQNGKVETIIHKTLLPTYDVFDEYRYFEPNKVFHTIRVCGQNLALTICEDLWNIEDDPLYTFNPMDELVKENPVLILNMAASPFSNRRREDRISILRKNAIRYQLPVYYVNQAGAQTELIFDGGSMMMDAGGNVVFEMKYFREDFCILDTENLQSVRQPETTDTERIHQALVLGLRDYFSKMNFRKAILGLSGGIDSAVVLALAAEALGPENVLSVLMPSAFSSAHSVSDSLEMCRNLGSPYEQLPINPVYESVETVLRDVFEGKTFDVTEENIQARIRSTLLMALSNKFGHILLNTSNKSELAVGYGTLYGDMCGGLSVIGDLYKTRVYELARFINGLRDVIPQSILTKEPSAELRPGQKDSDTLPPYELLDQILFMYIEKFFSPEAIIKEGFDPALVYRVLRMVNKNEYKRKQFAPILRVTPKAFGLGRRLPIVGKYLS